MSAGAIGLGGAIASSGGLISLLTVLIFAVLGKLSFDLVIILAVETEGAQGSYEALGSVTYGNAGRLAVMLSKLIYSFGCLVAYCVIVKDNAASALLHLVYGQAAVVDESSWFQNLLSNEALVTLVLSTTVILPLCMLRHMARLEKVSAVKIVAVVLIIVIVAYLFIANPEGKVREPAGGTYENWFDIRSGFLEG